ncbi:hypothetical protein IEQ34_016295 [Dendrobium chrysotoxum]|uniref:Uncharacterized protein n=1 Tax=Dendrobium chrysotoxum TaxID=161865 RepID=A0AAV7GE58_DENCH|nr:hypothetical protein IEQ34_016295 [Dendrobium chrysotoxum]
MIRYPIQNTRKFIMKLLNIYMKTNRTNLTAEFLYANIWREPYLERKQTGLLLKINKNICQNLGLNLVMLFSYNQDVKFCCKFYTYVVNMNILVFKC